MAIYNSTTDTITTTASLDDLDGWSMAFRWLQDEAAAANETSSSDDQVAELHEEEVLRNTAMVYGFLLCSIWILFCWLRLKYPRPFTIRTWQPDLYTPLADDQYGFWNWMWMIHMHTDEELLQSCGMDATCFLRTLRMGYRISLLGVANSLWLFPLYATARTSSETVGITDKVVQLTLSHVPSESPRLVGTVLAAYTLFGFTMYLILQEFVWFTEMRHKYLRQVKPRNYTVYVNNIPEEYRTNKGLEAAFGQSFSRQSVLEARLRRKAKQVEALVEQRKDCLFRLENALELQEKKPSDENAAKVEEYAQELKDLNQDITNRIDAIEEQSRQREANRQAAAAPTGHVQTIDMTTATTTAIPVAVSAGATGEKTDQDESTSYHTLEDGMGTTNAHHDASSADHSSITGSFHAGTKTFQAGAKTLQSGANFLARTGNKLAKSAVTEGFKQVGNVVNTATLLVQGEEDGGVHSAGFLTFTSLSTTNAALQMVHNGTPFSMRVFPAPDPDDVFWSNVGRSHKDLQMGKLFSYGATGLSCLFWTIPMTFFSSLSSVEGLKEQFGWIEDIIEFMPILEPILQQLAPFLVIAFNSLLPYMLQTFSMFEGPVSGSVVEASTFSKLAAFTIIQTFFVSAISGGLLEEIRAIAEDPLSAIDLLANTLPAQSTYFIQIVFVGTVIFIAMENLRVVALISALIRKFVGPSRTERQRQKTFMGIRPLADPLEFEHAANMAQITVLYFTIMLVYQTIAPLTSYVLGLCFLIMRPAFLHQFIYIYPTSPDSGGVIWTSFIKILLACMLIAEFTIIGLLGLKKAGSAVPFMIPLIVVTMLFNAYIRQEHFRVAEFLPTNECLKMDQERAEMDMSVFRGEYLQEALREKEVLPEDLPDGQAAALGLLPTVEEAENEILVKDTDESPDQEEDDDAATTRSGWLLSHLPFGGKKV